jgi:hypothetical protein
VISAVDALHAAGVLHLGLLLVNVPVAKRIGYGASLVHAAPLVRQIFWFHLAWICATLAGFGLLDLAFASALAGSPLGRSIAGGVAVLWAARLAAQLFVYDPEARREHRAVDVGFSIVFVVLAGAHAWAAAGAP